MSYLDGIDVLGADFAPTIGDAATFDVQDSQRKFNAIKQMTYGMARTILKGGQDAINGAIAAAAKKPHLASYFLLPVAVAEITAAMETGTTLPRGTARKNVWWKLKWHEDQIAKSTSDSDLYPYADDLKKWVQEAFIESNAVSDGAQYADQVYSKMWDDVADNITNLPKDVRDKVSASVSWLTGFPLWAWVGGGLALFAIIAATPAIISAIADRRVRHLAPSLDMARFR